MDTSWTEIQSSPPPQNGNLCDWTLLRRIARPRCKKNVRGGELNPIRRRADGENRRQSTSHDVDDAVPSCPLPIVLKLLNIISLILSSLGVNHAEEARYVFISFPKQLVRFCWFCLVFLIDQKSTRIPWPTLHHSFSVLTANLITALIWFY